MSKPASKRNPVHRFNDFSVEICILAGGLSKRMGRDKSRLRLGSTTMLGHIRKGAQLTGFPVRVIRRDCVPNCGPLGGVYTALKGTRAEAVLFLACDMPLITTELIQFVALQYAGYAKAAIRGALFIRSGGRPGFPFVLPRESVEAVHQQIGQGELSLQSLANALRATILPLKRPWSRLLFNVNTPEEWAVVRRLERRSRAIGKRE
jgi:molybdopterin-guanine dinucleotide biosynthesis protein A